jgi:hypothetical protein
LAKEIKPAFIYVQKVNALGEFTQAYLIHLLGGPLAEILKRLRKEDIAGTNAPNTKDIYMSASRNGVALDPTGEALRNGIIAACGNDLRGYSDKKSTQLRTLGYEDHPFSLNATLCVDNTDELVDAFLGLKEKIPAKNVLSHEIRFGLKKKLDDTAGSTAQISIQPQAADTCSITVRSDPLSIPATFSGEVFFPALPNLPTENRKILVRNAFFDLIFQRTNWSINFHADIPPQSVSSWAAYWRFYYAMKSGKGSLHIRSDKGLIDGTLHITEPATGGYDAYECKFFYTLCDMAIDILKLAGASRDPKISMKEISDRQKQLLYLDLLTHPHKGPPPLKFVTEKSDLQDTAYELDVLYIDWIMLGEVIVGYYGKARLAGVVGGEEITWTANNVELVSLVELHNLPGDLTNLVQTAKDQTGCPNSWTREWIPSDGGSNNAHNGELLFEQHRDDGKE